MKYVELNSEILGNMLKRLIPIAAQSGHQTVKSSISDNLVPVSLESEFIYDIFTGSVPEVAKKWYGSEEAAVSVIL